MYVLDNVTTAPPVGAVLFSNDLQTYVEQTALGTLAQSNGVTSNNGDLYWDGTTIIATFFSNPACIAVWTAAAGWTMPLVLNDGTSFLGGPGHSSQPLAGSQAIAFDGTTYAVGAIAPDNSTAVWKSTDLATWTMVNLDTAMGGDGVQALKWVPRLNLWVAIGEQIWTASAGAATWTSRSNADFYFQIWDDGTTLWVFGNANIWSSTNATSWTSNAFPGGNGDFLHHNVNSIFWSSALSLWIGVSENATPHRGILWATSVLGTWTYGYTSPHDSGSFPSDVFESVAQVGTTYYAIGNRQTAVNTAVPLIASSTDGQTWTIQLPAVPAGVTNFLNLDAMIAAPDNTSFAVSVRADAGLQNDYSSDGGATLTPKFTGEGHFTAIMFAASVAALPSVKIPSPVFNRVTWNALRVYAQAGMGAWDSSVLQPIPGKPHNFMINDPGVVQNLTIQVLKVEEGF